MKSYNLMDVVEQNRNHPDTFHIPSNEEILNLQIDDYVKLVFNPIETDSFGGERMWVRISNIEGDNFIGKLDNDPMIIDNLHIGEIVEFERKNIAGIIIY